MDRTLDKLLRRQAMDLGDKICIKTPDGSVALSYSDLDRHASITAKLLLDNGCKPGSTVIIGMSNIPEFFSILFACFRAKLIAVPIDTNLTDPELKTIITHANPSAIVIETNFKDRFNSLKLKQPIISLDEIACLINSTKKNSRISLEHVTPLPTDPALILYTSGTTGTPKGVVYSHKALVTKIELVQITFGFDQSFNSLCLLPTNFGHGLICNCLSTIGYGGTLVISKPFNLDIVRNLWSVVKENEINTFSSVPTVIRLLIKFKEHSEVGIPDSLKFITCASSPLEPEEIINFQDKFKVPLLNCYGLTETCGWVSCSQDNEKRNLSSVGEPIGYEFRVITPDGTEAKVGELGELQVKGEALMMGYYKNPVLTDEVLKDGWFATGDIGEIDIHGKVHLRSRIKDLIIRAGKNIFPVEVDRVLMSHPDVDEACAVGLKDPLLGEKVGACVVRKKGSAINESSLISFSKTNIADYKCPQHIIFVDSIPKNARGKINRSKLQPLFEVEAI